MTTVVINTLIHKSGKPILRLALLSILAAAVTLVAAGGAPAKDQEQAHPGHGDAVPAKLVEIVRNATRQFADVNAATAANYQSSFGCVSGPEHGAMGVHYVNAALLGDGELDATRPEALIYEPSRDGMRLVAVQFIVDAATWTARHTSLPVLEGQAFHLVNSPNRYGLPAFYELHVWAWRDNPNGAFVDWNTQVSCEGR